ncbi:hypothetical protein CJF36_06295 [Pseudomonas lundensis]|nr:hypothetical protein CJF36_06295 [Pseudomonas lundensis]
MAPEQSIGHSTAHQLRAILWIQNSEIQLVFLYQTGINAVFLTTLARTRKPNWISWKIDTAGKVAD